MHAGPHHCVRTRWEGPTGAGGRNTLARWPFKYLHVWKCTGFINISTVCCNIFGWKTFTNFSFLCEFCYRMCKIQLIFSLVHHITLMTKQWLQVCKQQQTASGNKPLHTSQMASFDSLNNHLEASQALLLAVSQNIFFFPLSEFVSLILCFTHSPNEWTATPLYIVHVHYLCWHMCILMNHTFVIYPHTLALITYTHTHPQSGHKPSDSAPSRRGTTTHWLLVEEGANPDLGVCAC